MLSYQIRLKVSRLIFSNETDTDATIKTVLTQLATPQSYSFVPISRPGLQTCKSWNSSGFSKSCYLTLILPLSTRYTELFEVKITSNSIISPFCFLIISNSLLQMHFKTDSSFRRFKNGILLRNWARKCGFFEACTSFEFIDCMFFVNTLSMC